MTHRPILAAAPNGAYKQKSDHPALPLRKQELARFARQAVAVGVSLLHLHIRDENAQHSLDAKTYQRTIAAIEDEIGDKLIIQITSEAANRYSAAQQIAAIKAINPACVSIALRELITDEASVSPAQNLFHWCAEHQCRAQYILYSVEDLERYAGYLKRDIIPNAPHSVLFVLGRYTQGQQSSPADLDAFLQLTVPVTVPWMVCAFGAAEQPCLIDASQKGGHVRQGFENNLLRADGRIARDNIQQLSDTAMAMSKLGLEICGIDEARKILSIR